MKKFAKLKISMVNKFFLPKRSTKFAKFTKFPDPSTSKLELVKFCQQISLRGFARFYSNEQNGQKNEGIEEKKNWMAEFLFSPDSIKTTTKLYDEKFLLRPLHINDYEKGMISILGQLTEAGEFDKKKFVNVFRLVQEKQSSTYIFVVEDKTTNKVVGCATLLVEQKFIRGGTKVNLAFFLLFLTNLTIFIQ